MAVTLVWIVGGAVIALLLMRRTASASPEALRQYVQQGAMVIDVRTPAEYRGGHVSKSVNIPLDDLGVQVPRWVPDKSQVLLLHCQSGMRSRNGQRQLQRLGYTNVFNLGSLAQARTICDPSNRH